MCNCEQELQRIFGSIVGEREEYLYTQMLQLLKCVCDCPHHELTDDDINRLG